MLLKVSIRNELACPQHSRETKKDSRKTQNVGLIPQSNTFSYLVQYEIVELTSFNLIFQFIFGKCNISTTYLLILTYSLFGVPSLQVKVFACSSSFATNTFGLGRPFYKSSRQLQNFRRHGDQYGPNLESCFCSYIRFYFISVKV